MSLVKVDGHLDHPQIILSIVGPYLVSPALVPADTSTEDFGLSNEWKFM